jgi:hypothetical protein
MNTMGYYVIFLGIQAHSDQQLTDQLDNDTYDESNTITISVPVSVPYMADQEDFTRAEGKFMHEGKYYRMVKQRYAKDVLTIICVRDTDTEQIQTAIGDYVKTFADSPQNSKQQNHSKFSFSFIKDFTVHSIELMNDTEGWNKDVNGNTDYSFGSSSYMASIIHPPC